MINLNWRKPSLTVKITVKMTITIVTAIAGVTILSLHGQQKYFQKEAQQKAEFFTRYCIFNVCRKSQTK